MSARDVIADVMKPHPNIPRLPLFLKRADAILSALKAAEEGYREIPAVAAALEFPANHVVTSEQIVPKIDEWKAELTTLRAENARLKRLLEECANDLAMEIDSRYPNAGQHPSEAKRRDRDMEIVNLARAALAVAEPVVREWERESTPGTVRIEQTIQGDTVSTRFDTSNLSLDDALAAVAKARDSLTTELDLAVSCPMHTALRSRTGVAP